MKDRQGIQAIISSTILSGIFTFATALLIDRYTTKQKRLQFSTQRSMA